jgi:hypothetical protein
LGDIISTGIPTTIPPGWYQDPYDPNPHARRWWDGNGWSAHVDSVAPPMVAPDPYAPPAYVDPFRGYEPPVRRPATRLDIIGWLALALGILDGVFAAVSVELPAWVPLLAVVSGVTVLLGIVALVLRGQRRASTLAPPIIAIILAAIIAALSGLAWAGQSSIHDQETAQQVIYPDSTELTALYLTTRTIERGIRAQGSAYHWPSSVTADSEGRVVLGGKLLGTLKPGQYLTYEVTKGGEDFEMTVHGTKPGEYFFYDLDTHEIATFCFTSDETCGSN